MLYIVFFWRVLRRHLGEGKIPQVLIIVRKYRQDFIYQGSFEPNFRLILLWLKGGYFDVALTTLGESWALPNFYLCAERFKVQVLAFSLQPIYLRQSRRKPSGSDPRTRVYLCAKKNVYKISIQLK
jgi:hypothetical protein